METPTISTEKIPDHVPEELIWDHSLNDFTRELDDPFIAASRLQEGPGILWVTDATLGKPAWVVTQNDIMRDAFMDYQHFTSTRDSSKGDVLGADMIRMIPVEVDPPEHGNYRRILNPYFTPKHVTNYAEMVQRTCDELMDNIPDPSSCEFISDFAEKFPNSIFLSLMGMPQDKLPQFLAWERQLLRSGNESNYEASREAAKMIFGYLHGFIEEQRKSSDRTEFIEALLSAEIDGKPLSNFEILGTVMLFYVAGLDTVYSTLGWVMRHLAKEPELQDYLRNNPESISKAVEEFTRAYGVAAPHRRVTEDFEFHGVKMRKGDLVLLPTYLASRDPIAFPDPHKIDLNRNARPVTFGSGHHTCLGVHLAKREIKIVLESFLSRFKSIRMPEGEGYEYHTGGVLGVDRLPLILEK